MTTEEAIKILDPETRRETLKMIPVHERISVDQEACRLAVAALRAQQQDEDNSPLTLDELRKMEGEPVWCEIRIKGKPSFYGIVHGENVTGFIPGDDKPVNLAITHVGAYGLAWLAYRHKPEAHTTTCTATNQPCAMCQPGPCDHRTEEEQA